MVDVSELPAGAFVEYLGLDITEAGPSRVTCSWTADARLHQPYGIVHGGAHCGVVETLASIGAAYWVAEKAGEDAKVVGVSNSTDFLRAVSEGALTSVGTPIHQGRSQQLWIVETRDDQDRLVARGQVRLQNLYAD